MEEIMSEQQASEKSLEVLAGQAQPVAAKKKASWWRTILWVLSMMLMVNVVMGVIAYFVFFYNK